LDVFLSTWCYFGDLLEKLVVSQQAKYFPQVLLNPSVRHRVHNSWVFGCTLRQCNPVDDFLCRFLKTNFSNKELLCITHTVEHNYSYISPSSTVGIQLHVSALHVGHLQCCDLTYRAAIQDVWCVLLGHWVFGGGSEISLFQ